jgi:4-hydroxy-3-methylbut-2-enyl diphosphate reductase
VLAVTRAWPDLVVTAALRIEAHALRRGLRGVSVLRTGMGPGRARAAVQRLRVESARSVAVAGLCGALDPALEPGTLFVASELRGGECAALRLEPAPLCAALERLGLEACVGPLVSVDHVVRGAERERLHESGAIAVDMESAWLAPGAGRRPLAVLRAVFDGPGRETLRPTLLRDLLRALRGLREAAPALAIWASTQRLREWPMAPRPRANAAKLD